MEKNDKRKHGRVRFLSDLRLTADGKTTAHDETMDVSMGGLFVVTETPMPKGTKGAFRFNLRSGDNEVMEIKGNFEVVTTSSKEGRRGMGIKFGEMDADSSLELYKVIRYNSPEDD